MTCNVPTLVVCVLMVSDHEHFKVSTWDLVQCSVKLQIIKLLTDMSSNTACFVLEIGLKFGYKFGYKFTLMIINQYRQVLPFVIQYYTL